MLCRGLRVRTLEMAECNGKVFHPVDLLGVTWHGSVAGSESGEQHEGGDALCRVK